jgi:hypothetical protein
MNRIGVILNTYKRRNIGLQLEALRGQTVKPADLLVWRNDDWTDEEFRSLAGDVRFVRASENMGVWPRFLVGCLVKSDFVAVFDDDTVPGCRWLENCLTCYERQPGVYGANGIRLPSGTYHGGSRHGWVRPVDRVEQVDVVGHAWFIPQWLCLSVMRLCGDHLRAGEDMALSFTAQQNGFDTFTPPHPRHNREPWGSLDGRRMAGDGHAISATSAGWRGYEAEYRRLRGLGWRLMADG